VPLSIVKMPRRGMTHEWDAKSHEVAAGPQQAELSPSHVTKALRRSAAALENANLYWRHLAR
jgi:hypothetical protein